MPENPFLSPLTQGSSADGASSDDVSAEKVYQIAKRQHYLNVGILAYVGLIVFRLIASTAIASDDTETLGIVGLIYIVCALVVVVFVLTNLFSLARALHNTIAAVLLTLLGLIPLLGLLVFFVVSNTATKLLRQHGIEVGLLGADLSQFNR